MKRDKGIWVSGFAILLIISILYYINNYMPNPIIVKYVASLGGSGQAVGIAGGAMNLVALLLTPFVGPLVDRVNRKRLLALGFFLLLAANLLAYITESPALFVASRIVQGIGFALNSVLLSTIVASMAPKPLVGKAISVYASTQALAQVAAPSLGLWIRNNAGYRQVYLLGAIMMVLCLFLVLIARNYGEMPPLEKFRFSVKNVVALRYLPIALSVVVCGALLHVMQTFIEPFTEAVGHTAGVSLFFVVYAVAMLLSRFVLANWMDRYSLGVFVLFCAPLMMAAFFLLQTQSSALQLCIGGGLCAVGLGTTQIMAQVTLVKLVSPQRRGIANSTYYIAMNLGHMLGGYFGGLLIESEFAGSLFYCCLALAMLPLLFALLSRKQYFAPATQAER